MMFWGVVLNENRKIFGRSLVWIALAILVGISMIMFGGIYFYPLAGEADIAAITWPLSLVAALQHSSQLGVIIVVLLIATVSCQDYSFGTMRLWLSRGLNRSTLWAAKSAAVLLPLFLIAALPLLISIPMTGYFTLMLNGTIAFSEINFIQVMLGVVRTVFSFLPYASFTLFIAVTTRSMAASFGGGLAFALLENLSSQIFGERIAFLRFLPRQMANALADSNWLISNATVIPENSGLMANEYAFLGLLAWTALFFGLTLIVSRAQDLTE